MVQYECYGTSTGFWGCLCALHEHNKRNIKRSFCGAGFFPGLCIVIRPKLKRSLSCVSSGERHGGQQAADTSHGGRPASTGWRAGDNGVRGVGKLEEVTSFFPTFLRTTGRTSARGGEEPSEDVGKPKEKGCLTGEERQEEDKS